MRREIRFGGFGGQGIVTAGIILARAAALYENMNALQTQSYGPEARGGASKSEVIISDSEIYYPKVKKPEIFVCMSQQALEKYFKDFSGILIYDSSLIKNVSMEVKAYSIPATMLAMKKLGKTIFANIIMLGALVETTKIIGREALKSAVLESVPRGTEDLNMKALKIGFEEGKKALEIKNGNSRKDC